MPKNTATKTETDKPKRPVGRPPLFTSAEDMQILIDDYFEYCKGELLTDKDGEIVQGKYGPMYIREPEPPTTAGLAYHLGFAQRQQLWEYGQKPEYADTITRARLQIERYAEKRLYDRDGAKGAEFNLINNFGWQPTNQVNITNNTLNIDMSEDEIVKRLAKSGYFQLSEPKLVIEQKEE